MIKKATWLCLLAAAVLAACGGGGDGGGYGPSEPPPASAGVPDSANASIDGLIAWIQGLIRETSDTTEPVSLDTLIPPTSDTAEPSPLR